MIKLAFASCSKIQDTSPQPVWAEIMAQAPDVLLLLGDTVYLQHNHHQDPQTLGAELTDLYRRQFEDPHFAALIADMRARGKFVEAIYDDHDFLGNNRYGGDVADALRLAARKAFVAAFEPSMTGSEVYRTRSLGLVDLLVLDARYHRRSPGASGEGRDAVLGDEQWQWLEQQVERSTAPFLVVASSTTLHSFGDESWEQYGAAFRRMVDLLAPRRGALFVSGDVHRNAVYDDSGAIEIVSSAVARRGIIFGGKRRNHGLLTFAADQVRVQLFSLKAGGRFDFSIPLMPGMPWQLP